MRLYTLKSALLTLSLVVAPAAFASTATFATITGSSSGIFGNNVGFIFNLSSETTYTSDPFGSFSTQPAGTYTSSTVSNTSDNAFFQFYGNGLQTFTFSTPVTGLILDEYSLGGGSATSYTFNSPFTVLSCGANSPYGGGCFSSGGVGSTGTVLTGAEANGAIEFAGPISTLSFTITNGENYNGFDLGILPQTASNPVPTPTPEPGSILLVCTGLAGLGGAVRRRFSR